MKKINYILHYFFGKHKWKLLGRFYKEKDGEEIDYEYIFGCKKCQKEKHIKLDYK